MSRMSAAMSGNLEMITTVKCSAVDERVPLHMIDGRPTPSSSKVQRYRVSVTTCTCEEFERAPPEVKCDRRHGNVWCEASKRLDVLSKDLVAIIDLSHRP